VCVGNYESVKQWTDSQATRAAQINNAANTQRPSLSQIAATAAVQPRRKATPMKLSDLNEAAAEIKAIEAAKASVSDATDDKQTIAFNNINLTAVLPSAAVKTVLDAITASKRTVFTTLGVEID
jgi:Flp pilus assembly protein TadB